MTEKWGMLSAGCLVYKPSEENVVNGQDVTVTLNCNRHWSH